MKQKIFNLDIARLIASFFIVAIHVYPFNSFNENLDFIITRVLFRIAVPLFLMITGFFVLPKILKDQKVLWDYTKKIFLLYAFCILLYLPIQIYNGFLSHFDLFSFLKSIFFTGTFYHLWYFPALILGLWFLVFLIRFVSERFLFLLLFFFYFIGLFGDSYYGIVSNISVIRSFYAFVFLLTDYTRNGIFYVPIFLYLGYFFHLHKSKLSLHYQVFWFLLFWIFMGIEGFLLVQASISRHTSMYFFLIPTCYFLFSSFQNVTQKSYPFLRELSTNIYIWHPIAIIGVRLFSKLSLFRSLVHHSFLFYLMVVIVTLLIAIFVYFIKNMMFHRFYTTER